MHTLLARDYPATPWKNGGGTTRQILISPPDATLDDFDYRISMASVASDGPFSHFAGIDRQLLLLDGNGLLLERGDGSCSQLDKHSSPLAFVGEEAISSRLQDGPVLDFNVMTRRGRYRQQVESFELHGMRRLQSNDEVLLVILATGNALEVRREDGRSCVLGAQDALLQEMAVDLTLSSAEKVRIIVVRLNRQSPA
jgi:environmental stress-induced protein Ves